MECDILKLKYHDSTFEAMVDRADNEIVVCYRNDLSNEFRISLDDLGRFSDFIDKLWEEAKDFD